ncbi:MAG: trypsin-like peptidase domain-containing protein [Gammaproteobacteria bacterium]|nr:trypsin-like peptidase domain-containing protein [Gammaproteobacteria bacterium]
MAIRKFLSFILQTIMTGLAAAFLYVLLVDPDLLRDNGTVVEVVESRQEPTATAAADKTTTDEWNGPVSYADAVEKAVPAVVNIHTAKVITHRVHPLLKDPIFQKFFGDRFAKARKEIQTSLGSGVLISSQGHVLTNNHVIEGADQIQVLLADGRSAKARVVGTDLDTDLAVLHITADKLPSIIIGNSSRLRVGDVVLAIGNPFGVGQTVTSGIISATGRNHLGITAYEDFIQTDAAINPGNSGGALIDTRGALIGINSAIYSQSGGSQGIGFAIPISLAKGVMTQIIEKGYVARGWLGIEAQDMTPQLAKTVGLTYTRGMLIGAVISDGPAADAGLLPGDIVVAINGESIMETNEAMRAISRQQPGTTIELSGLRKGVPFTTHAKVIQRPGRNGPAS